MKWFLSMSKWKVFLDYVTDAEDAFQRMLDLAREAGEADIALAASDAADHLLVLAQVLILSRMPATSVWKRPDLSPAAMLYYAILNAVRSESNALPST